MARDRHECDSSEDLTGKTVIAAAHTMADSSASENDRSFFCVSKHRYGYEGFWLVDGTKGYTASFLIEAVLEKTPSWAINKYPRIASVVRDS